MVLSLMKKTIGLSCIKDCLVLPFATGMSLTIALLTLRSEAEKKATEEASTVKPDIVIFPRIDQKTCLKAIYTANLTPIVIEPLQVGDELRTDVNTVE